MTTFEYRMSPPPGTAFSPNTFDNMIGSYVPFKPHGNAQLQAATVSADGREATLRFACPDGSPLARWIRTNPRPIVLEARGSLGDAKAGFEAVAKPVPTPPPVGPVGAGTDDLGVTLWQGYNVWVACMVLGYLHTWRRLR